MTNIIKSVRDFTQAIGCTTDSFNVRQTALYTGLQTEEFCEKIQSLLDGFEVNSETCTSTMRLMHLRDVLCDIQHGMKSGEFDNAFKTVDRAAMLDADVDLAWVTIGSMISQGADVEGACGEVSRANMSKLVRCQCTDNWPLNFDGAQDRNCPACNGLGLVAIKDNNGKVKKPEGWIPPNIEPFIADRMAETTDSDKY